MNIKYRKLSENFQESIIPGSQTVYYEASLDDILDTLEKYDSNIFIINELQQNGLDAINIKNHLYGSRIIRDKLYICVSDGYDIVVNNSDTNPFTALFDYSLIELADYIQDANQDIIHRYITPYEVPISNLEESASYLLDLGYDLKSVTRAYNEIKKL